LIDKTGIKERVRGFLDPVVDILSHLGVSPLSVTIFGVVLSVIGAVFVARGYLFAGGIILLVGGLCDTIDGSLARQQKQVTDFGAFLDSTADRIAEVVYLGALVFYFFGREPVNEVVVFFILVAITGSFLTSYARARAEGLGLECTVGWMERAERVTLLVVGLLLGRYVLIVVIFIIALFSVITFIQRVKHVRNLTLEKER
jgi:CDP-diacylglycerol--glycerol-3-phosphate 3-phosphatidyltransferase